MASKRPISGVLYFTGFVGYDQFYLSWICLAPLLIALRGVRPRQAILIGWLMGLTTHMGGYGWVIGLLRDFASLPTPAAFAGYVLLCAGQGAFFAVYAWMLATLWRARIPGGVWLAPVVHAGLEVVYPFIFRSYLANSQIHFLAFMQIAELVGVIGMGFLMVLVSSLAAESFLAWRAGTRIPVRGWAVAAVLFLASVGYGWLRIPQIDARIAEAPSLKVGIVQANVGQGDKDLSPRDWIALHRRLTARLVESVPDLDLVVWPETAYNRYVERTQENLGRQLQGNHSVPMVSGIRTWDADPSDGTERRYNSAVLIDSAGRVQGLYDKNRLLVFGEYLPLSGTFPSLKDLFPHTSHFTAGTSAVPMDLGPVRIGVHICYEDILPGFVQRLMAERDGRRPDLLVNLTNDSWFGDTMEPTIHLALAAFRSVEHRRTLVRSTNTGISAMVDAAGRIGPSVPQYRAGNLVVEAPLLSGSTVYEAVGDAPAWICLGLTLLLVGVALRRPGDPTSVPAQEATGA